MKSVHAWTLFGLISLAGTAWAQTPAAAAGPEKVVIALENKWLKSYRTNNPDLIAPHLAEDFVATGTDGKFSHKAEFLADTGAIKFTHAEYEDMHVSVFGRTAVATGGFKGKGTDASGKPFDDHSRWTDTWVKMPDGKWQCVASQDTLIPQ